MIEDGLIEHWWLVRHAPVRLKSIYGQMDVDADFSDVSAFEQLKKILPEKKFTVSSDLSRCVKTAQRICGDREGDAGPMEKHRAFREQHFGDWQGLTFDEAKDADQMVYQQFWENPAMEAPPRGESFSEVMVRVIKARKELSSRRVGEDILVVAHAGTIRALLADALGISPEKALLFTIDPLSLTKLTVYRQGESENWQINWINRTY